MSTWWRDEGNSWLRHVTTARDLKMFAEKKTFFLLIQNANGFLENYKMYNIMNSHLNQYLSRFISTQVFIGTTIKRDKKWNDSHLTCTVSDGCMIRTSYCNPRGRGGRRGYSDDAILYTYFRHISAFIDFKVIMRNEQMFTSLGEMFIQCTRLTVEWARKTGAGISPDGF